VKAINYVTETLDKKKCSLSLFVDLSKAFHTVDHNGLIKRLSVIVSPQQAVRWFANYLESRTQIDR